MEPELFLQEAWTFTDQFLTDTINDVDNVWGYYGDLGYSPGESVDTTVVEISTEGNEVRVLPTVARGGPETPAYERTEETRYVKIPSIPVLRTITPDDIQNWVKKSERTRNPKTLEKSLGERLEDQRYSHDLTLEYFRVASHRGELLDGNGKLLLNIFELFDTPKKQINFALNNPDTNLTEKISELHAHIRHNLRGEMMTGIEIHGDRDFFNAWVTHPDTLRYYENTPHSLELMIQSEVIYGRTFVDRRGVTIREYDAPVTLHNGTVTSMIPSGSAQAFPVGTRDAAQTYFGPPYNVNYANANQGSEEITVTQELLKHGKGIEIRTESNPLSIWRRPNLLVECLQE